MEQTCSFLSPTNSCFNQIIFCIDQINNSVNWPRTGAAPGALLLNNWLKKSVTIILVMKNKNDIMSPPTRGKIRFAVLWLWLMLYFRSGRGFICADNCRDQNSSGIFIFGDRILKSSCSCGRVLSYCNISLNET